jgi:tetratricopeptide (TPR) repeat protein
LLAVEPHPTEPAARALVEEAERLLAELRAATDLGRSQAALELAPVALSAAKRAGYRPLQAELLLRHAKVLSDSDRPGAEPALYEGLELAEAAHDGRTRAGIWLLLAQIIAAEGRLDEAERALRLARAIEPGLEARDVMVAQAVEASLRRRAGDHEAALRLIDEVLDAAERAGDALVQADTQLDRADVLIALGRFDEAAEVLDHAGDVYEALAPDHPENAVVLDRLAGLREHAGDLDGALALRREALALLRRGLGDRHRLVGAAHVNLGGLLVMQGHPDDGLEHFLKAREAFAAVLPADHIMMGHVLAEIATAQLALERPAEAVPLLEQALTIRTLHAEHAGPPSLARLHHFLAIALWDSGGDAARARTHATKARALYAARGEAARAQLDAIDARLAANRR